jgi:hypothetical protein
MVVPAAVSNGLRDADSIRARQRCEIFVTLRVFLNRVTVERAFSAVMSPNHNEWGSHANGAASMHQSTWVVLFLLMFGEIAVLAVAGFILWIMGEFDEDTPRWHRLLARSAQAAQSAIESFA